MSSDTNGLISAVRAGNEERVRELVNSSSSAGNSLSPLEGYVLLVEANEHNHTEIAKFLLTNIIDAGSVEAPENLTESRVVQWDNNAVILLSTIVVLTAVNCYDTEIVEMLLKRNPTVSKTLLFAAIQNNRSDIVTMLLNRGFDVNAPGKDGITPLQYAIQINKILINETLQNRGTNETVAAPRSNDVAPLLDEYTDDILSVVKKLSVKTPCVTRRIGQSYYIDYNGYTDYMPLHVAIRRGNAEMVKLLLSRGADVDIPNKDEQTAFQLAVKKKRAYPKDKERAFILAYVVMSNLDLDKNNNGNSVLEKVSASAVEYVDILSECKCRRSHVTKAILQIIHDNRACDRELLTSLVMHAAVERGYSRIVKDSFDCATNVKLLYDKMSVDGFTLLHSAVNSQQTDIADTLLLTYGADINARDALNKTPIYYAIENGDVTMTTRLLCLGADVRNSPDLLNAAVRKASTEIVNMLLRFYGSLIDVNAKDECGSTALHYTALEKQHKMGFNDNVPINRDEDSISCISAKADIADLLIANGAIVDASNNKGQTPLHAAARRGYPEVVEVLLKHKADVAAVDNDGATPLHFAAWHTSAAIAEMLLRAKARVNARRKDGSSVLRDAVVKGNKRVIELLLRHGADINATCKCGKTLLECHTQNRHRKVGRMGRERWSEIANILKRHIVKMRAANVHVSEKNVLSLRDVSGRLSFFHDECSREIERMKSAKIGANVSFYDIAMGSPHQVAVYARFTSVLRCMEAAGYTKRFPIYRDWIQENFRRGQEREVLLVPGVDSLHSLLGYSVPDVLTLDLFGFLGNDDLRNLIEAGDCAEQEEDDSDGQDDGAGWFASRCHSRRSLKSLRRVEKRPSTIATISAVGRHMKCPRCGVMAEPTLFDIVAKRNRPNYSSRLFGVGHPQAHRKFTFYGSAKNQDCPLCSNLNLCPLRASKLSL